MLNAENKFTRKSSQVLFLFRYFSPQMKWGVYEEGRCILVVSHKSVLKYVQLAFISAIAVPAFSALGALTPATSRLALDNMAANSVRTSLMVLESLPFLAPTWRPWLRDVTFEVAQACWLLQALCALVCVVSILAIM